MAASAAVSGFGTIFAYESATDTFTALGEIVSVNPPKKTRGTIQVTHMTSDDGYHEYIPDLKDGGEFAIAFNYTETGQALAQTLFEAGREKFKITVPGLSTIVFDAIPTEEGIEELTIDGKVSGLLSGKVTGKPVYTVV